MTGGVYINFSKNLLEAGWKQVIGTTLMPGYTVERRYIRTRGISQVKAPKI